MPKRNRYGKAAILSQEDKVIIRYHLKNPKYQLLWDCAIYTGERWGALVQLLLEDCYDKLGQPRNYLLIRPQTRKSHAGKSAKTREVPTHPKLKESLLNYALPNSIWLFPTDKGKGSHISFHSAAVKLQKTLSDCGLGDRGISTHSTRRTFITDLHNLGTSIKTIATITGHKSLESLKLYIEDDPELIQLAIGRLE